MRIGQAGPVAHQAARLSKLAHNVNRRHRLLRRQSDQVIALIEKEWIGADHQRIGPMLHQHRKGRVEIAFGTGRQHKSCSPSEATAALVSLICGSAFGLFGFTSKAIVFIFGVSSRSNSSRFAPSATVTKPTPVMLPSGRLMLLTIPDSTGSLPIAKMIGIVAVADLAASAAGIGPAKITSKWRATRSAAAAGSRSY